MTTNIGNYIGRVIGDYTIIAKNRVNNRMKYFVKCKKCGVEKWVFNVKGLIHGTSCEGRKRKTGSKKIGVTLGDYIVVSKNIVNDRSSYTVKCKKCNSVKDVWNLREEYHNEWCENFCDKIIGEINGDYMITKAYKKDRVYVDVCCIVCGAIRKGVAYKDFNYTFKNKHSKICTIKNTSKLENKQLVRKLMRTFQNINSRIKIDSAYKDVENNFKDSVDFITYVYDMYIDRLKQGYDLSVLSIDRINPYGNYEKGNVRCLTLTEQQYNKKRHYNMSVETIESSVCDERVE